MVGQTGGTLTSRRSSFLAFGLLSTSGEEVVSSFSSCASGDEERSEVSPSPEFGDEERSEDSASSAFGSTGKVNAVNRVSMSITRQECWYTNLFLWTRERLKHMSEVISRAASEEMALPCGR
jgi:hypothetical protein